MVSVSSLRYRYENGKALSFPDFTLEKGKTCLLMGNSGSGKTTLLHLMGGLLRIQEGKIEIENQDLSVLPESQADHFRGRNMGFIFQRNHLITALTVEKNLLMAPFLANVKQDEDRIDQLLEQLGLSEKKHEKIHRLSQGQAQRVAIARAVLNRPSVIFADEPTSALDDAHCDVVIGLLTMMSEQNESSLIVATHDQRLKSVITRQIQIENQ